MTAILSKYRPSRLMKRYAKPESHHTGLKVSGLLALGAIVLVGVLAAPEIRRYLHIRRM